MCVMQTDYRIERVFFSPIDVRVEEDGFRIDTCNRRFASCRVVSSVCSEVGVLVCVSRGGGGVVLCVADVHLFMYFSIANTAVCSSFSLRY